MFEIPLCVSIPDFASPYVISESNVLLCSFETLNFKNSQILVTFTVSDAFERKIHLLPTKTALVFVNFFFSDFFIL